jgi:flagellar biosynthesis protein FliQ
MSSDASVDLIRHALMTAFWIALPLLAVGFVAGILISLVQIVTSIQDAAFGAVPRLIAFLAGFILLAPWMLLRLTSYTAELLSNLGRFAR